MNCSKFNASPSSLHDLRAVLSSSADAGMMARWLTLFTAMAYLASGLLLFI
jgi:hypothetical protein